ncbi:MAG: LacI family transcriptional regulator [Spirochaetes bacterium]|nr:LacI family transcriptional regulator [Spirochaetota bacterium]
MNITRKFIAEKAGVSPTAVSDVLNNNPIARIGKEARKRILSTAKKYNYFPNITARSLVMQKTFNIGFINTIPIASFVTYPFNNDIFIGLEKAIEDNGYSLVFSLLKSDGEMNFSVRKMILGNIVDGIVLYGHVKEDLVKLLMKNRIPFVLIDYYLESMKTNAVLPDNSGGAYEATKYLIDQKLKKIICLNGNEDHPAYKERPKGYSKAMKESKLIPEILSCGTFIEDGYEFMTGLLKKGNIPEAIITTGDPMAIGVLRALKEKRIKVPDQIKLIGFDNIYLTELESPKLSTVDVPKIELGQEAVRLLLQNILKKGTPSILRLPTKLILRETT